MPKLIDNSFTRQAIGRDGLLILIDEINAIRARSGNRRRFRPHVGNDGVMVMHEIDEVQRPSRPDTPSPRYAR